MAEMVPTAAPPTMGARYADHTEDEGWVDLAVAVLTRLIEDLGSREPRVRLQARHDVRGGGADWALGLLPVSDDAVDRVRTLLWSLTIQQA